MSLKEPDNGGGFGLMGSSPNGAGVWGTSGPAPISAVTTPLRAGVRGEGTDDAYGVHGSSVNGVGVFGRGATDGVVGESISPQHSGVWGTNSGGGVGVAGNSTSGTGIFGRSDGGDGVRGETQSNDHAAVSAVNRATGIGLWAESGAGGTAGFFKGDVTVTGVINMTNADYAEDFTVSDPTTVQPGMVMILDETGNVQVSQDAYDTRVAGVVSGAGDYRPAVILDRCAAHPNRLPLALMGKVYCMVDATTTPVAVGDLLTTSGVPGHAMKAADRAKSFGSVIGKALRPLTDGRGLIPILVCLQ